MKGTIGIEVDGPVDGPFEVKVDLATITRGGRQQRVGGKLVDVPPAKLAQQVGELTAEIGRAMAGYALGAESVEETGKVAAALLTGPPPLTVPKVTIGRMVTYRSKTGDYDLPAIVAGTVDSIDPEAAERGGLPALESDQHVHLVVLTAGKPRVGPNAETEFDPAEGGQGVPGSINLCGTYQEWNVPPVEDIAAPATAVATSADSEYIVPGSWRWPERV